MHIVYCLWGKDIYTILGDIVSEINSNLLGDAWTTLRIER